MATSSLCSPASGLHVLLGSTLCLFLLLQTPSTTAQQHISRNLPPTALKNGDERAPPDIQPDVVAIAKKANSTGGSRAEVVLLVPAGTPRMDTSDHFSASSMLMDYSEDTRKFLITENINNRFSSRHHRRHHQPRDHSRDLPSDQPSRDSDRGPQLRTESPPKRLRVRVPIKAFLYGDKDTKVGGQYVVDGRGRRLRYPIGNNSWIALHSPVKIYIPVTYKDENSILSSASFKDCVQCPSNFTLSTELENEHAKVPVPAISICSRLARRPGSMNVAVTLGPRPGAEIPEGQYPVELIVWKPGGHVHSCRYTITVKASPDKPRSSKTVLLCSRPKSPGNGTVVCNSNGDGPLPDASVCQFFCFPGFQISGAMAGGAISVCKDGKWSIEAAVTCKANHCPVPLSPKHGSVKCQSEGVEPVVGSKYRNGTVCHFRCKRGYVVPTSQLPLHAMACHVPDWNATTIPECKRADFPKHHPKDCSNFTRVVKMGGHVLFDRDSLLSWFSADGGRLLTPSCTLLGKRLSRGVHLNFCEVTDPELRVTTSCRYFINVRERGPVYPHPRDCRNRTHLTSGNGRALIKTPRFFARIDGKSGKVEVSGTCTYSGELEVGSYINHCAAIDPETNSTAHCTYAVTVKGRSCPPPPLVAHATVHCGDSGWLPQESYAPGTACTYSCGEGYVIPRSQMKWGTKICHPKLSWRPSALPVCVEETPPTPRLKDCKSQVLFLPNGKLLKKVKPPRFKSSHPGSKVRVKCSLSGYLPAGNYTNFCEATDAELNITVSCKYSVLIQVEGCTTLPSIPNGWSQCTPNASEYDVPAGTTCTYECSPGYTIPTSQLQLSMTSCVGAREWNSTAVPECIAMIAPVPKDKACLNETIIIDHMASFSLKSPEFSSGGGVTLLSNCTPSDISSYGVHDVICTAFDPEIRIPSSCEFQIEINAPGDEEADAKKKESLECKPPELPSNGFSDCLVVQPDPSGYRCRVFCQAGFEFPSEFKILRNGSIKCDGSDGLWDFQRVYGITSLPECLGVLPTTAMQVWLSFSAAVESCEDTQPFQSTVRQSLLSLNNDTCRLVDCDSAILADCSWNDHRNRHLFRVNWTIQAEYDPAEYEGTDLVPPVETQIENILESTQKAVTTEDNWRKTFLEVGLELHQDSYRRGHFRLACMRRGYVVDTRTDKCMECPKETREVDGQCQTCPEGQYQPAPGQVKCEDCPKNSMGRGFPSSC